MSGPFLTMSSFGWAIRTPRGDFRVLAPARALGSLLAPDDERLDEILFFARAVLSHRDPQAFSAVTSLRHELGDARPTLDSFAAHEGTDPDEVFRWLERALRMRRLVSLAA